MTDLPMNGNFVWMCQRCGCVGFHSEACIRATAEVEKAGPLTAAADPGHISWYPTDEESAALARLLDGRWAARRKADCAEAVAAERARITREVHKLWCHEWPDNFEARVTITSFNSALGSVLAIVHPEDDR